MVKKEYVCNQSSYDYFDYEKRYTGEKTILLGNNPREALAKWRQIKSKDYSFSDSYRKTEKIRVRFMFVKEHNKHNFYTPEWKRIKAPERITKLTSEQAEDLFAGLPNGDFSW